MTRRGLLIASMISVAGLLAAGTAVGTMLPGDARLPIHWNLRGEPDQYAGKWVALSIPAAMTVLIGLLFHFLPAIEPRKQNLARSQGLYLWAWASLLLTAWSIMLVLASTALAWGLPASRIILGTIGVVLALIGNQLGKSRSMYLVGLRTPWTLDDEEVWIRSNRLAGKLIVAAGLAIAIAVLLPIPPGVLDVVVIGGLAIGAGVPIVHSFIMWRRARRSGQPSE